jgi:hypothetical protein
VAGVNGGGGGKATNGGGGPEAGKGEEVGVGWQPPLASTTEESDGHWVSKTMEKQHSGFLLAPVVLVPF